METQYQKLGVLKSIIISNEKYSYKTYSEKEKIFTYRCFHRICKCYIKITKEEIDSLSSIDKKKQISFKLFNKHNHKDEIIVIDSKNVSTEKELEILAISLIKQNLIESLEFHVRNFKNNNIEFSRNKIKNLLQKIREADIPKDQELLADLSKIKINYDDLNKNEEGVPFCLSKSEFINLRYKNRLEKYVIFTSLYQLKMFGECDEYYADGTFKSAPKGWYQLFNIWGYKKSNNIYLPLANIIMSNKSYEIYDKVIKEFLSYFENYKIDIDFKNKGIMTDYEHSLRTAIKNNLPDIKIRSCYFHYSKAIYKKAKFYNLFSKKKENKYNYLFHFKIISIYSYKFKK